MSDVFTVGSTYDFQMPNPLKDGQPWDLTNGVVKLLFKKPSGSVVEKSAVPLGGPTAGFRVINLPADLDVAGAWTRAWKVTDGAVVQISEPIPMKVVQSP